MNFWYKYAFKNPVCPKFWGRKFALLTERLRGVDFSIMVDPQDVGLSRERVHASSPTGRRWLCDALRKLPITPDDAVIDIGCGKGAGMRVLLEFPFKKVDGVEIAEQIAAVARRNFQILKIPPERCHIYTSDAGAFKDLDSYTYIYFYNPFPPVVMAQCVQNISESLKRSPRKLTIVYNHPTCHSEIIASGVFTKEEEFDSDWGHRIFVYRNH